MSKFSLNNIDKSSWESFKFQEIAERISISVDPTTTELEVYVGLEHIDAEDIHIRRFGKPSDVTGNKLKCFRGDVIFGKRRAYQRKAAIVDFEGICSAHSFVFRAKPNIIDPKLFPFFLHSDQFMHRAVDISVGGLSPTINWGDLKDQEFLLPPKEEQKNLSELLWAMDDVIEKEKSLSKILAVIKKSYINNLMVDSNQKIDLQFLFQINWGNTNITKKSYVNIGYPAFSATGCDGYLENFDFDCDGIVLSAIGAECGKCFIANGRWTAIKNTIVLIPLFDDYKLLRIVFDIINNKYFWKSSGGAQPFISQADARKSKVPLLNTNEISEVHEFLNKLNNNFEVANYKLAISQSLQKSLINQIF